MNMFCKFVNDRIDYNGTIAGCKSADTSIGEMLFISSQELDPLTQYTNSTGVYFALMLG